MAVDIFMVVPSGSVNPPMPITVDPVADPYYNATFVNAAAVELRQFSLAAENPTTIGSATSGAGAGKCVFNELFIEKSVDMLSRSLFTMAARGAHFTKLQLYVRRADATGGKPYLIYSFGTVYVSKIDWTTSSGDDEPRERVTFVYGAMALIYSPAEARRNTRPRCENGLECCHEQRRPVRNTEPRLAHVAYQSVGCAQFGANISGLDGRLRGLGQQVRRWH